MYVTTSLPVTLEENLPGVAGFYINNKGSEISRSQVSFMETYIIFCPDATLYLHQTTIV